MAVRVDDDVDEVGVVEGRGGARVGRLVEAPRGRPEPPQQLAEIVAVLRETGAAALVVEVVLVPEGDLALGGLRLPGARAVLDVLAVAGDADSRALGPQRGHHARGAAAP